MRHKISRKNGFRFQLTKHESSLFSFFKKEIYNFLGKLKKRKKKHIFNRFFFSFCHAFLFQKKGLKKKEKQRTTLEGLHFVEF
jgi:hypothetical protein